jgi:hypothetical protein
LDPKDGESTCDALFIYPFVQAVTDYVKEIKPSVKLGFRRGEAALESMGKQLKDHPLYKAENHIYLADDILKLYGLKDRKDLLAQVKKIARVNFWVVWEYSLIKRYVYLFFHLSS